MWCGSRLDDHQNQVGVVGRVLGIAEDVRIVGCEEPQAPVGLQRRMLSPDPVHPGDERGEWNYVRLDARAPGSHPAPADRPLGHRRLMPLISAARGFALRRRVGRNSKPVRCSKRRRCRPFSARQRWFGNRARSIVCVRVFDGGPLQPPLTPFLRGGRRAVRGRRHRAH